MSEQIGHCGDNLSDAGFVVSSEKRIAVGDNQILTEIIVEFRKLLRFKLYVFFGVEHDVTSVIALDNTRANMSA